MTSIALYWPDKKLYPTVEDILQDVFDKFGIKKVVRWTPLTDRTIPVLALGAPTPAPVARFVQTISQKQIMSNPAAVTEVNSALSLLLTPPSFEPMKYEVWDVRDHHPGYLFADLCTAYAYGRPIVVDIETSSGGRKYDELLPEETYLLSVGLNNGQRIIVLAEDLLADPTARQQLAMFLTSGRKLIAHNMKFDFRSLTAITGCEIKGHLDTMLLHHVINPGAREHGLKALAQKYLGAPEWEKDQKQYFVKGNPDFAQIPREILYEYNAGDVYWTYHLYRFLSKIVEGNERLMKMARFEFAAGNLFQDVENNGIAVDLDYLSELEVYYTAEKERVIATLRQMTNYDKFNPNSPVQVKQVFSNMGIELTSTAEGVLEELKPQLGKQAKDFVDLLLEYRGYTKMLGTYVNGITKRIHNGNLVYPTFKVHGTNTGRLSAADPNVQNIPRDTDGKSLRRIFVPRSDDQERVLLSVDYSQAELRVMACLSGDEYLISLFQEDSPDFFDALMPVAFPRLDLDAIDKNEKKNKRAKLKGVIYGLSYGRKEFAIAKSLDMPVYEAKQIITNYFKQAPQLYDWRMWITEVALSADTVLETPFGRYFQSEVVTGRNKQNVINSSLAFLPQSTASDLCVSAAIEVHKKLKARWKDSYIVATIHDAILIDCPKEQVESIAEMVQLEMRESGRRTFGDTVVFATDATWGTSWEGI